MFGKGRRPSVAIAALILGATLAPRPAIGGYIAGDLGSGNSFNPFSGYALSGPNAANGLGYGLAVEFEVSGSSPVAFGSAVLALEFHSGTTTGLTVLLDADAGGTPGSTLQTMSVASVPAGPSLVTAFATAPTMLDPGTNYWLVAVATNDAYLSWMANNQGASGDLAYRTDTGSAWGAWQGVGAADVAFGINPALFAPTTVPAPPSVGLLGIGLLWPLGRRIGRLMRRRG